MLVHNSISTNDRQRPHEAYGGVRVRGTVWFFSRFSLSLPMSYCLSPVCWALARRKYTPPHSMLLHGFARTLKPSTNHLLQRWSDKRQPINRQMAQEIINNVQAGNPPHSRPSVGRIACEVMSGITRPFWIWWGAVRERYEGRHRLGR
jgi:hypothetical protein